MSTSDSSIQATFTQRLAHEIRTYVRDEQTASDLEGWLLRHADDLEDWAPQQLIDVAGDLELDLFELDAGARPEAEVRARAQDALARIETVSPTPTRAR